MRQAERDLPGRKTVAQLSRPRRCPSRGRIKAAFYPIAKHVLDFPQAMPFLVSPDQMHARTLRRRRSLRAGSRGADDSRVKACSEMYETPRLADER